MLVLGDDMTVAVVLGQALHVVLHSLQHDVLGNTISISITAIDVMHAQAHWQLF